MLKKILYTCLFSIIISSDDFKNAEDLFLNGKYDEARLIYEQISDKNTEIYYLGYEIYFKLDNLEKAYEYINLANKENESYLDESEKINQLRTDINNAKVTLDNGFINEAIEEYKALLNIYKDNGIVYYRIAYAYKENNDYDNAAFYIKKAINVNPYKDSYKSFFEEILNIQVLKGKEEYKNQDYQLALEYYNKALEYDSTYSIALFSLGNLYYKLTDYQLAIDMYKKGIEYSDLSPKKYLRVYQLGRFYTIVNNPDKALESFNYSLELQPGYPKAMFEKAKILISKDMIDEAKVTLLQITDIDPTFLKAYEQLMDIEKTSKNYSKALEYGNMCLDFNPSSYSVLSRISSIYNEKENYETGKEYAKKALNYCKGVKKKECAPAYFELAISDMNLCNKLQAKDSFTKAGKYNKKLYGGATKTYIKNLDSYMEDCQ